MVALWMATSVVADTIVAEWDIESGSIVFNGVKYTRYVEPVTESAMRRRTATYAFHVLCTVVCILFAALAAGLTMGLVSLDSFDMKILMEANEADCLTESEREELRSEKAYAEKVLPLVSRHHLLLVTLLLMNSIANEALPLFLNELVPPVVAVIISVTAVLIFGEILPSAIFTGQNQLAIGAALSPLVWFFIYFFWIISYPISLILDRMLGEEHKGRYNKAEFRAMINLHNEATDDDSQEHGHWDEETGNGGLAGIRAELGAKQILNRSGVAKQELRIMTGALELHRLKVKDVMHPLDEVYMLSTDAKLDSEILSSIVLKGHSRIPVYEGHPHNIRGMLLVKRLIVLNPEEKREVGSLALLEPLVVGTEMTLLDLLYEFSLGKSHLAIITSDPERVTYSLRNHLTIPVNVHMAGIVTLEDVIERLIKHDIQDESDKMSARSFDNTRKHSALEFNASDTGSIDGEYYGSSTVRLTPPLTYSAPRGVDRAVAEDLASLKSLSFSSGGTPAMGDKRTSTSSDPLSIPLLANADKISSP